MPFESLDAVCEIFSVNEWRNLGNQVRGRSRSLKMAPFDRPCMTLVRHRDLEIWVRGHSRSLKLVPFKSLGAVSYSSARYSDLLVENCEIFIPHLYLAPPEWGDPVGML